MDFTSGAEGSQAVRPFSLKRGGGMTKDYSIYQGKRPKSFPNTGKGEGDQVQVSSIY